MCEEDKYRILELLDMLLDAVDIIQQRTSHIKESDDFLLTPDNMFILDGVCMKLIFIGESIKTIDKISKGRLLVNYPLVPWKDVMKMRDIIAHHYFKIDAEIVFIAIKEDLTVLAETLSQIKIDLKSSI
jgi:uncharacterized protein with HEPN domain